MSSLAATQADGYYQPPEEYGQRKKRKRKNDQRPATPTVRFELPHSGICNGCQAFIKRGTRFNAAKKDSGEMYFSSKIWDFHFSCRSCTQEEFVVRNDPQNRNFRYVSGIRKQQGEIEAAEEARIKREESEKDYNSDTILTNLERHKLEARSGLREAEEIRDLIKLNNKVWKNDAQGNAALRQQYRHERHKRQAREKEAMSLGWDTKGTKLLNVCVADEVGAKSTTFKRNHKYNEWKNVRRSSIFADKQRSGRRRALKTTPASSVQFADNARPDPCVSYSSRESYFPESSSSVLKGRTESDKAKAPDGCTSKSTGKIMISLKITAGKITQASSPSKGLASLLPYGSDNDSSADED